MAQLGGEASTEIDASIDEVWAVVEDGLSAPDRQGALEDMEEIERDAERLFSGNFSRWVGLGS
jgi:hypothetical protein